MYAPMDASVARSRLSRDDRMEQTLTAAHQLFAERGYADVKMDEIAAAVGVTKPLLYNYFGNKERLYIACMERAGDSLIATIADAVGATENPGDALGAGVRAFFSFLDTDRSAWTGLSSSFLPTIVNLPPSVANASVQFKWRLGCDNSNGDSGWYLDSVYVWDGRPCCFPIVNAHRVTTNIVFSYNSAAGQTYIVEAKPSLSVTNWTPLKTNVGDGTLQFYTNSLSNTQRFFRLRAP